VSYKVRNSPRWSGAYRPEHDQAQVATRVTGAGADWIDPATGRASCPSCDGFGYHENDTDEGEQCEVCGGHGVARATAAERWIKGERG